MEASHFIPAFQSQVSEEWVRSGLGGIGLGLGQSGRRNTDGPLAHRWASSPQTGYYPAQRRATSFEAQN